jgi:hypothetical protein
MHKWCVVLLAMSPYLAFFAWFVWWLITDAVRERRRARHAVQEQI